MEKLHITGAPRSGTTLLVEMMRACFRCDGAWEHETSVLNPVPSGASVYITKLPEQLDILPMLMRADPHLHAIYIERDPRSVIASVHQSAPDRYATEYTTWQRCHHLARGLRAFPKCLCVRYEDLVCAPDKIQLSILQAFPWLEQLHAFSSYQETAIPSAESIKALDSMRPVNADRIKSWHDHLPRIKEQLAYHPQMVQELVECGYESDESWTLMLKDVPLQQYDVWREPLPNIFKRFDRWQRRYRKIRHYLNAVAKSTG